MKLVCINNKVRRFNSKRDTYEIRDPFLVIGKVYSPIHMSREVVIFNNDEYAYPYNPDLFVTLEEWREMKLKELGI